MKITLRIAMIAAKTVVLLSATSVFAQAPKMRAHIPFAFGAGEARLPAGDYRISLDPTFHRFLVEQEGGSAVYLPVQRPSSRGIQERGTLVFNEYGDRYFLRRVATPGDSLGFERCVDSLQNRADPALRATLLPWWLTTAGSQPHRWLPRESRAGQHGVGLHRERIVRRQAGR